jgi:hypothetical protein
MEYKDDLNTYTLRKLISLQTKLRKKEGIIVSISPTHKGYYFMLHVRGETGKTVGTFKNYDLTNHSPNPLISDVSYRETLKVGLEHGIKLIKDGI